MDSDEERRRRRWRSKGGETSDTPTLMGCDWPVTLSVRNGSPTKCCQRTEAGQQPRGRGQKGKSRRSSSSSSLRQEAPGIWLYCHSAPRLSDSVPLGFFLGLFFYFLRQVGPQSFPVRSGSVNLYPVVRESILLAGPETARACSRMTRPAEVDGAFLASWLASIRVDRRFRHLSRAKRHACERHSVLCSCCRAVLIRQNEKMRWFQRWPDGGATVGKTAPAGEAAAPYWPPDRFLGLIRRDSVTFNTLNCPMKSFTNDVFL